MLEKPQYLDLFSGCGGLSVGLERAGWRLDVAVEKSPMAAHTFFENLISNDAMDPDWEKLYPKKTIHEQIEQGLVVRPVSDVLVDHSAMEMLKTKQIDLIVGGPPCQGFSLAGRRNQSDERNNLAWDFLDLANQIRPKFIVIENVLGMNAKFSQDEEETVYQTLATALQFLGDERLTAKSYIVQKVLANALHYGAAQHRPRLLLVACRLDIAEDLGITASDKLWKSDFKDLVRESDIPDLAPNPAAISPGLTVEDALSDIIFGVETRYTTFLKDAKVWSFLSQASSVPNHKARLHGSRAKQKFAMYHLIKKLGLNPILMRDPVEPKKILARQNALSELGSSVNFPIVSSGPLSGLSEKEFIKLLESLKTRKHSQRVLDLDKPAPTVVTAADDLVHPTEARVLTVRELARFQGFPDSFVFKSKETTGGLKRKVEVPQYSQVGNAVSPFLAHAIGSKLLDLLKNN